MEKKKFQMPHTYIIIFGVILVAALLTCFIPLGKYDTKEITYTVNGSEKTRTVVDPDSFQYILDENGNVIYQPDESLGYERLYPINSHLILSIRAKTGFDGKSASMCVLDQDGQFLYDIDSAVTPNLTDIISFDSEGVSWTIPGSLTFGPDDDLGENSILRIDFVFPVPEY